jgi:hypothetical protein
MELKDHPASLIPVHINLGCCTDINTQVIYLLLLMAAIVPDPTGIRTNTLTVGWPHILTAMTAVI